MNRPHATILCFVLVQIRSNSGGSNLWRKEER